MKKKSKVIKKKSFKVGVEELSNKYDLLIEKVEELTKKVKFLTLVKGNISLDDEIFTNIEEIANYEDKINNKEIIASDARRFISMDNLLFIQCCEALGYDADYIYEKFNKLIKKFDDDKIHRSYIKNLQKKLNENSSIQIDEI